MSGTLPESRPSSLERLDRPVVAEDVEHTADHRRRLDSNERSSSQTVLPVLVSSATIFLSWPTTNARPAVDARRIELRLRRADVAPAGRAGLGIDGSPSRRSAGSSASSPVASNTVPSATVGVAAEPEAATGPPAGAPSATASVTTSPATPKKAMPSAIVTDRVTGPPTLAFQTPRRSTRRARGLPPCVPTTIRTPSDAALRRSTRTFGPSNAPTRRSP